MICGFCKKDSGKLNRSGFCRRCGPVIRHAVVSARRRARAREKMIGPPHPSVLCKKIQQWATSKVRQAKLRGALPMLPDGKTRCVDCGGLAYGFDHRDYLKPLDVEPVCRSCNSARGRAYPLSQYLVPPADSEHVA